MSPRPLVDEGVVVGNVYDKYATRNPVARRLVAGYDRGLASLLDAVGPVRSALEVGCGEGRVTARLAERFPQARVLGTDRSGRILQIARREHPGLAFAVCSVYDVERLGRWDLVVACEMFEHLEHPERALDAICDARPGHVLVTVPREPLWRALNLLRGAYWSAWGDTPGHLQHWSRRALLRFLARRLEIVAVRAPLPWVQVLGRPRLTSATASRMPPR
jgi:trans-aconitate methyltransferase